jgi:raffinose/stachyose/melibiose transport system permease protein
VSATRRSTRRWPSLTRIGVVLLAIVIVGVPFWVLVVNSLKPYAETIPPNLALPFGWTGLENYGAVLAEGSVGRGFLNTAIVLVLAIPVILVLSAAAAWVFIRVRSRGLKVLYYAMLIGVAVPPAIVASIFTLKALGIYGGLPGLSALYAAWFIPLAIFLIAGFVRTIPVELEEAARIDGAGNLTIFARILLPLLAPVLVTTAAIVAIALWNDFLTPFMMLTGSQSDTLMLSLFDFSTASTVGSSYSWNLLFADVVLTTIPMLIAYYVAQRYVVHGLAGAGK